MPKNAKKSNSQKLVYVLPHKMRKSKNTRLDFGYMLRLDPRNLLKPKKMKKKIRSWSKWPKTENVNKLIAPPGGQIQKKI